MLKFMDSLTKSQRLALIAAFYVVVLGVLAVWLGDAMLHHRFFRG